MDRVGFNAVDVATAGMGGKVGPIVDATVDDIVLFADVAQGSVLVPDTPMNKVGHTMDVTMDGVQLVADEKMDDVKLTTGVFTDNVKPGGDETSDGGVAIDKEDGEETSSDDVATDGVVLPRNGPIDSEGVLVDLMVAGSGPTAEGTDDNVGVAVGMVTEGNTELIAGATADDIGSELPGNETK